MKILCGILAVFTLVCVAAMLTSFQWGTVHTTRLSVLLASSGFVSIALVGGAWRSWYGRFILIGLIGCWCGDMLGPRDFVMGLTAFLLAHLAFMAAFLTRRMRWTRCLWFLIPLTPAVGVLLPWLLPHVQAKEQFPIIAYIIVISAMLWLSSGASYGTVGRFLFAAAIIFFISDIFVARWRYVDTRAVNSFFCYPLYYTACVLFALSVCWHSCDAAVPADGVMKRQA